MSIAGNDGAATSELKAEGSLTCAVVAVSCTRDLPSLSRPVLVLLLVLPLGLHLHPHRTMVTVAQYDVSRSQHEETLTFTLHAPNTLVITADTHLGSLSHLGPQ